MARRIIAALLIILASILAPFAIGALWADRTITETDTFVETLAPLADDPAVQQTVATEVSTALIDAIDAQSRIEEALSKVQGPLAGLRPDSAIAEGIASGINGAIESGVTSYTQSDRFGDAWMAIATLLQEQFVRLINRDTTQRRGDPPGRPDRPGHQGGGGEGPGPARGARRPVRRQARGAGPRGGPG